VEHLRFCPQARLVLVQALAQELVEEPLELLLAQRSQARALEGQA
jgi:hypothetical protein